MTHYFIDNRSQPDGAREIHAVGCKRMPSDKQYLGDYFTCQAALIEARKECWHVASCLRCMDDLSPSETSRLAKLLFDFPGLRSARS